MTLKLTLSCIALLSLLSLLSQALAREQIHLVFSNHLVSEHKQLVH